MKSANGASTSGKQVKAKSPKKATKCKVNLNGQGLYEWHTSVTAAMARRSKPQVLHFPRKIARLALQKNQKTITLEIKKNGTSLTTFPCKILTAKRSNVEKYISEEWCTFVTQRKLRIGDKLFFKVSKPSTTLKLRIIRV
ncbi:hypothetical protein P8452_64172 [Trifolium repens]|nr:hypothetical protein P8452_15837 [Trifolium repens]WJX65490.1 hypothetical protein P8452_50147 [Trifolium repens]WJX81267.1 hypothetical protein P8452_64172 [Trifolium repens]